MLPPPKEMTPAEAERWTDELDEYAFKLRQAKKNQRTASALTRTFRSTTKKWRDYYGHDSGRCRIVLFDDKYDPEPAGKAFVEAQLLPVADLVSRLACRHEHQTVRLKHKTGMDHGVQCKGPSRKIRWTVTVKTCTRCGAETRTKGPVHEEQPV